MPAVPLRPKGEIAPIPLNIRSLVRIRPLMKKECDESIIVDRVNDTTVALHPNNTELLSPTHNLGQNPAMMSPSETKMQQIEFDGVFGDDLTNERVWGKVGDDLVGQAMEPLIRVAAPVPRHVDLVIGMGRKGSGKTYTLLGDDPQKRKNNDTDGLMPRLIDSLFSQSKHQLSNYSDLFSISLTILQVTEPKNGSKDDVKVSNLLPASSKKAPSPRGAVSTVRNLASKLERGSSYSTISDTRDVSPDSSTPYKLCHSAEEARSTLAKAMQLGRRLTHRGDQSHSLYKIKPMIVSRTGKILREGGLIAILDMAGREGTKGRRNKRDLDHQFGANDAHLAVLHCLRALKENADLIIDYAPERVRKVAGLKKVPFLQQKVTEVIRPFFSSSHSDHVSVMLLAAVGSGHREQADTRKLLQEAGELRTGDGYSSSTSATTGLPDRGDRAPYLSKSTNPAHPRVVIRAEAMSAPSSPRPEATKADAQRPSFTKEATTKKTKKDSAFKRMPLRDPSLRDTGHRSVTVKDAQADDEQPGVIQAGSMTYSDSTFDDEISVVPVPPPIAPSYSESKIRQANSVPLSVEDMMNNSRTEVEPSAPPFEDFESPGGVPLSPTVPMRPDMSIFRTGAHSVSRGNKLPLSASTPSPPCPSPLGQAHTKRVHVTPSTVPMPNLTSNCPDSGDSDVENRATPNTAKPPVASDLRPTPRKFGAMSSLQKAVKGTKKGMRAVQKMSTFSAVSTSIDAKSSNAALERRIRELEEENKRLRVENQRLRERNEDIERKKFTNDADRGGVHRREPTIALSSSRSSDSGDSQRWRATVKEYEGGRTTSAAPTTSLRSAMAKLSGKTSAPLGQLAKSSSFGMTSNLGQLGSVPLQPGVFKLGPSATLSTGNHQTDSFALKYPPGFSSANQF